jgi:hypothetical protein
MNELRTVRWEKPEVVKAGQKWKSIRNGKTVLVLEVKEFIECHGIAARVETKPGWGKWLTVGAKGIKGYTLVE